MESAAFFGSEVDFKSDTSLIVPLPSSFLSISLIFSSSPFFFFSFFSFLFPPPRANLANQGPTYEVGEKAASHWPILIEPDQPRNSIR